MPNYIGEIAGLATSLFYTINAVFITRAGKQVGSSISNRTRVFFALIYLILINWIFFREPLPFSADQSRWMWLSISGVIGLAVGDAFLFQSYLMVGPQVGMLLLSLSPVIGAFEAWWFLGESLTLIKVTGILLALGGIIWVILSRGRTDEQTSHHTFRGVVMGLLAAVCNASGLVLSRQGMGGGFSPFQANAIRMSAALLALVVLMLVQGETRKTVDTLRGNSQALKHLAIAGFVGPVLGVSSSLLSVQYAEVGVAGTLTSLSPVFMLLFGYFFFGEKPNWQSVAGTLLTMGGVALLFLA
jgi:drug/metabolite transporter (DMT)-like permease